jgi:hypothetical protein
MRGSSSSVLKAVGVVMLGVGIPVAAEDGRTFDAVQLQQQVRTMAMAEASGETFGESIEVNEPRQLRSIPNEGRGDRAGSSQMTREQQREHSRQRLEKRLNHSKYGDGYKDSAAFPESGRSSGSRYGSGYESRMSGRQNGAGVAGFTGGPRPAANGSAGQGGGRR